MMQSFTLIVGPCRGDSVSKDSGDSANTKWTFSWADLFRNSGNLFLTVYLIFQLYGCQHVCGISGDVSGLSLSATQMRPIWTICGGSAGPERSPEGSRDDLGVDHGGNTSLTYQTDEHLDCSPKNCFVYWFWRKTPESLKRFQVLRSGLGERRRQLWEKVMTQLRLC